MALHKGNLEYNRFSSRRISYKNWLSYLDNLDIETKDIIENFSIYSGHMTISRFIGLYDLYKKVLGVAGHIMEIGTYEGASLLWFAKLVKIFEHESLTQVHGFDWFEGTGKDVIDNKVELGTYKGDEKKLSDIILLQELTNICFVHKMDVTQELIPFFEENQHLMFKIAFFDAGVYSVVSKCLPVVWERITPGGILVLDQYNHELSPGETIAVREILPNAKVKTIPNIWMPTAYIVKE